MECVCVISLSCFKIYNAEVSHVVAYWMWWLTCSRICLLVIGGSRSRTRSSSSNGDGGGGGVRFAQLCLKTS